MKKGEFNINKIPQEIQLACLRKMFAKQFAENLMTDKEAFKISGEPFI